MFWDDDIDVFFDDFAVDAVYTPTVGEPKTISVLFDADEEVLFGGVISTAPAITAITSDVSDIKKGETIEVDGTTYKVWEPMPDKHGTRQIFLTED